MRQSNDILVPEFPAGIVERDTDIERHTDIMAKRPAFYGFCSGGYGTALQCNFLSQLYLGSRFILFDDYLPIDAYRKAYLSPNIKEFQVDDGEIRGKIVPSYDARALPSFLGKTKNILLRYADKKYLDELFFAYSIIPYISASHSPDRPIEEGLYVRKPRISSGGKNISVVELDANSTLDPSFVYQKYCPDDDEYLVDCVKTPDSIYYSVRKSLVRSEGRDAQVSFDFDPKIVDRTAEILSSFSLRNFVGPFNIQLRSYEGVLAIQECDFRLSGSSICSTAYKDLIKVCQSPHFYDGQHQLFKPVYVEGAPNEECVSSYRAAGLRPISFV